MKTRWKRAFILGLVAALAMAVACGDDDGEDNANEHQQNTNQDNDQNGDQNDNQNNQNNDGRPTDEPAESCADLQADVVPERDSDGYDGTGVDLDSDYELIFNDFSFDLGTPGSSLNSIISNFLDQEEQYPIIVLFELDDLDVADESVLIRGGAGLHADEPGGGEYVWDVGGELDEPDSAQGTIDEEGWFEARLELFNFVATLQTEEGVNKTILPIRDLDIDAQLRAEADGSDPHVIDGNLSGVIWYDDVKDAEIVLVPGQGTPLVDVLEIGQINCDYNDDGLGDAWLLSATFSAEETVIVE